MTRFFSALFTAALGLMALLGAKEAPPPFEEGLELHKISEYWKEKDYSAVKIRISAFLDKNPGSIYCDQLYAMQGDLYFQEKSFQEAATAYGRIQDKEFGRKTRFHHLHSLYETKRYGELIGAAETLIHDPNATSEQIATIRFELAEACFCMAHAPENEKNKKELLQSALSHYNQVMQTKFADMAILPQAQIYAFLEEYAKAASLYLLLAQRDGSKQEDYLFQAGCMQLRCDKKGAIATFGTIAENGGKKAPMAAFNQLSLLFQEKQYREFILTQDKVLKHISPEKLPLMQYYLGKSLLHIRDSMRAIDPLTRSLSSRQLDRTQEMDALVALITCAKEADDLPLFDRTLAHVRAEFPNDVETSNILLMHAQLCRDKKEWSTARADIDELLAHSPHHPMREELLYDRALMLVQEGKLVEGASDFEGFINAFPKSSHRKEALRHLVSARLETLKTASNETLKIKQQQLLDSLQPALEENSLFAPEEREKMRYLVGKTQYSLGLWQEAVETLGAYIRDFPTCADACLLLAHCYRTGLHDETQFCVHVEKALALDPQLPRAVDLHLALYNCYLGQAEKAPAEEKHDLISKAAHHLFLGVDKPINDENLRWLAGYYDQQFQNGQKDALAKAAAALEKLLNIHDDAVTLTIDAQSLEKEGECLKLADIYSRTGHNTKRATLLQALTLEQSAHPELHWKYQRMAQFELGKAFLALNEQTKALGTFKELVSSSSHISSFFAIAAQLESAKLEFSMLSTAELREDSDRLMAICDALKEVQIRRKLYSEPLHLEAALCYIDIKTEIATNDQKNSHRLFLLETMKESFSSTEDPLVSEYLATSSQFPEQERLHRQYLAYVDAEMLRLKGQAKEAQSRFNQLLGESPDATLIQRIRKSTEALAHDL